MPECAFCPSTAKLTGEHLWSDWFNGIFLNRSYMFQKVKTVTKHVKRWKGDQLNLDTNVVCGECNSGWMSKVDNDEAKPILRHLAVDATPRKLPIRLLISLAIFGFKTAVV